MKILKKKIYILYINFSKNGILHFSFAVLFMIVSLFYLSITLFAIYLGYILFKYPNSSDLYEPMFVSYCLLAFIGIGTSI